MAGLQAVPAVVRDVSDKTAIAMALIENIQRADLNPLEEAEAMQRLISEFEMTHQEAAEAVSRSRAAVSNLLRLLELTREVQDLVRKGALEMGHARALLALKGPAQTDAARRVVDRGLTVRDTELWCVAVCRSSRARPAPPRNIRPTPTSDSWSVSSRRSWEPRCWWSRGERARQARHPLHEPGRAGRHPGPYPLIPGPFRLTIPSFSIEDTPKPAKIAGSLDIGVQA